MTCSLCGTRKARRGCPALGQEICPICCGTKRLTEIRCPADCPYLASAREHPPAALVRLHQADMAVLRAGIQDLDERQRGLFVTLNTFFCRHEAPELQPVFDADVAEASSALAATLETAARGVIYEHRAESRPAERLLGELRPLLAEAGRTAGSAFERDAGVVLRRIAALVGTLRTHDPSNRRGYLDLMIRLLGRRGAPSEETAPAPESPPRLIVP